MKSGFGIRTNLKTAILSRLRQEFPPQLSTFLFESLPTLLVPVLCRALGIQIAPIRLLRHFDTGTIRVSNSEREGKYIS